MCYDGEMVKEPTIGLEIHVELLTNTKMFCRCRNSTETREPNVDICPVCLGHPGTLPTINQEAVKHILRVGLAVEGQLADFTEFDRKNYFYPDIPKGYQISQDKYPLVRGGSLTGVDITRIHLEEDTAKLHHDPDTGDGLVDFNRSSLPLMELVTEPVITSAKQAVDFARELKLLLGPEYLNISGVNMEKGEMRIEANVSWDLGDKVEIKNLNSFRSVERAIEYELERQKALLEKGQAVLRETRGFNDDKQITFGQRQKEQSHDYRYFPDPDLPKMYVSELEAREGLEGSLPESPWAKRDRFKKEYELKDADVEILIQTKSRAGFFEATVSRLTKEGAGQTVANILNTEIPGFLAEEALESELMTEQEIGKMKASDLADLVDLYLEESISSRGVKDILAVLIKEGGQPEEVAKTKRLLLEKDHSVIQKLADQVIAENPEAVSEYQAGKASALQYLIGQGMKLSQGSIDPKTFGQFLEKSMTGLPEK